MPRLDALREALNPMALMESVFGKFRKDEPSKNRTHCARCRRKYNIQTARLEDDPAFNDAVFCSALCADQSPAAAHKLTRQVHRAMLRKKAKSEIERKMGHGDGAANPRRERRRVALNLAKKYYRDEKVGLK